MNEIEREKSLHCLDSAYIWYGKQWNLDEEGREACIRSLWSAVCKHDEDSAQIGRTNAHINLKL